MDHLSYEYYQPSTQEAWQIYNPYYGAYYGQAPTQPTTYYSHTYSQPPALYQTSMPSTNVISSQSIPSMHAAPSMDRVQATFYMSQIGLATSTPASLPPLPPSPSRSRSNPISVKYGLILSFIHIQRAGLHARDTAFKPTGSQNWGKTARNEVSTSFTSR